MAGENAFLRGWNQSEVLGNQRGAHALSMLSGLMQLQAAQENAQFAPLKRKLLEEQVAQAQRNNQIRQMLMGGGAPSGAPQLAFGEGGVSMPGGAQGNVNTGQVVQGAPRSPGFGGVDSQVAMLMLSGDPGLKALGTAILEQNKPIPLTEGGSLATRDGRILVSRPKLGENVLPVTDPQGNVTGVRPMPGATDVIRSVVGAQEGPKMGEFTIGGRSYKMPNEDYAALTGGDQLKAVQVAERYGIPFSRFGGAGGPSGGAPLPPAPPPGAPRLPGSSGGIGTIPTSSLFGGPTQAETTQATEAAKLSAERAAGAPQAKFAYDTAVSNLSRLAADASALVAHPGTGRITGLVGALPDIPGSKAANARAKLDVIKSQTFVNALQAMRDASKTGGALGNVSIAEVERMENNIASLMTAQSEDEFKAELRKLVDHAQGAKDRLTRAFQATYGGQSQPQSGPQNVLEAADAILNGNR